MIDRIEFPCMIHNGHEGKKVLCEFLVSIKVSDGYASDISWCIKTRKISNFRYEESWLPHTFAIIFATCIMWIFKQWYD